MAEPPGDRVPGHGLAAHAAAPLRFEALHARPHGWDVTVRKIERHRVGVECGAGVDLRPSLDDYDIDTMMRQVRRKRPARSSRANDADIVNLLCHRDELIMPLSEYYVGDKAGRRSRAAPERAARLAGRPDRTEPSGKLGRALLASRQ